MFANQIDQQYDNFTLEYYSYLKKLTAIFFSLHGNLIKLINLKLKELGYGLKLKNKRFNSDIE